MADKDEIDWESIDFSFPSDHRISRVLGCSVGVVRRARFKAGVEKKDIEERAAMTHEEKRLALDLLSDEVFRRTGERVELPITEGRAIDWSSVDLATKTDMQIAAELGCTRQTVCTARNRLKVRKSIPERVVDWDAIDWRLSNRWLSNFYGISQRELQQHRPAGY